MNMILDDVRERVTAYLNDTYLSGDRLFEDIIANERCVKVLENALPSFKRTFSAVRNNVVERTSINILYILLSKGNKRFIKYQGQKAIVNNIDEAIDFINTLINYKAEGIPVIVNDLCKKRLLKIFSNEWDGFQRIHARNTGNRPIIITPALGDTIEEHLEITHSWRIINEDE